MAPLKTIYSHDENFPALLNQISNVPEKIFVLGDEAVLNEKLKIAIVGTRKASLAGRNLARKFAKELTQFGITVVSGLAMGIDSAAHEGTVQNAGKTIAVLANGLDKIYPAQNENLANEILKNGGALISEYAPGLPSLPHQFLERNRIISGLCVATIIIEAPDRSGSLATARFAAEQGREVFVVPGPINDVNYIGSHKLIRDGARLASSIKDIFEDLDIEIVGNENKKERIFNIDDPEKKQIVDILIEAGEPLSIDKIANLTKLEPQVINPKIAFLVIEGIIKETEKGYTI
ncbi:MAG: DNA-processing protein DprA [Patescibacteria group bacterium]